MLGWWKNILQIIYIFLRKDYKVKAHKSDKKSKKVEILQGRRKII